VIPESRGFDAQEFLELADHHHDVTAFMAPTMLKRIVQHPVAAGGDACIANIRNIIYGGGPMYLADLKEAQRY
jgi:long-chain acyl-CoA synthetase